MSALIGVLMDVSGSMQQNAVVTSRDEKNTSWAKSIFEVVDGLIKHDVSDSNKAFTICFGGSKLATIFDLLNTLKNLPDVGTLDEIFRNNMESNVSRILDILENCGAPYVRKWADTDVITKIASKFEVNIILAKLIVNENFKRRFVHDCLPSQCRDGGSWAEAAGSRACKGVEKLFKLVAGTEVETPRSKAENDETKEAIQKAMNILISEAGLNISNAVMSVKQASNILRECAKNGDVTKDKDGKLLNAVEPFIYGGTPLWEAVDKSADVFSRTGHQCDRTLLFVLSDGEPSDDPNGSLERLRQLDVTVVTLYITNEHIEDPCQLFSKESPHWSEAAKLLFGMSSTLTTQSIPRTIFIKKGWKIDDSNNETKLFFQVNHPDLIENVCSFARDVICSEDAMAEVLSSASLDIRSYMEIRRFVPKEQKELTCYANAIAAVIHMATRRIVHRRDGYPEFESLREDIIRRHGSKGAFPFTVLQEYCPKYRLQCQKVDIRGAMNAISKNRPVLTIFRLTADEWRHFKAFYQKTPNGVLSKADLDVGNREMGQRNGHAVVLTSYNSRWLRFMNSHGTQWGDGGFFKVQSVDVLRDLQFMDVFWTMDDLLPEEKDAFAKHGNEVASMLIAKLKGLQEATHKCPKCEQESKVNEFTGHLFQAECPRCHQTFDTTDTQNSLALSLYFTSLAT